MNVIIKRIYIKNFKLFKEIELNIGNKNLIILDGPNGYGKTSFFDAIELLFTGTIRRYSEIARNTIDNRSGIGGSPFLNEKGDGDVVVKAEIQIRDQKKILMRKGKEEILKKAIKFDEQKFELYEVSDFKDNDGEKIVDEINYLSQLLGENYLSNFKYLHYIEQEETAYLLKYKDGERTAEISYLFNTSEFEEVIDKLKIISSKIGELCSVKIKQKLDDDTIYISELEKEISDLSPQEYFKLFSDKEFEWDKEKIEFKLELFYDLVGENGLLEKIKKFVSNVDDFKKYKNNLIIKEILKNEVLLKELLYYYNFINNYEGYEKRKSVQEEINNIIKCNEDLLNSIVNYKVFLSDTIIAILPDTFNIESYNLAVQNIQKQHQDIDSYSKIVVDLKGAREKFNKSFSSFIIGGGDKEICPFCGYNWKSINELDKQIKEQTSKLDYLIHGTTLKIKQLLEDFRIKYFNSLIQLLNVYVENNSVDKIFVDDLSDVIKKKEIINDLYIRIKKQKIDIDILLNKEPIANIDIKFDELERALLSKLEEIDETKIGSYFNDIYLKYFNEKYENVKKISLDIIDKKRDYLKWKYSIDQSATIKKKKNEVDQIQIKYRNSQIIKKNIDKIRDKYEESLKKYQKDVIEDIEILLNLFSGRIFQDSPSGLGIFIYNEKAGIKFLENPNKKHDAVFSMSSGQIAALIISFTLALNKKYSINKMLFIDDPVQTLDELNIAGLVDLLRNEFSDRQIFISTHEDMMSAYIRYKFEKYNNKTDHFDFQEIQLNNLIEM